MFGKKIHIALLTSIVSVCACLAHVVPGGVMVLTMTKALGDRFSVNDFKSLHAGKNQSGTEQQ